MVLHKAWDWEWKTGLHTLVSRGGRGGVILPSTPSSCVHVFHENVDLQEGASCVGPKPVSPLLPADDHRAHSRPPTFTAQPSCSCYLPRTPGGPQNGDQHTRRVQVHLHLI